MEKHNRRTAESMLMYDMHSQTKPPNTTFLILSDLPYHQRRNLRRAKDVGELIDALNTSSKNSQHYALFRGRLVHRLES
ncbi:hypothetical protein L484_027357 [Morus notabilis]|uniref:Uncharacterized protein n=1 Tax=Morus notabilis TaxID=981085 RepID=W9R681_9ROSA|nr:hypothetical protein L484_027357 [Morus notabilis]